MKILFGLLITIICMATLASAGTAGPGKISRIMFMENGTILFTLSGPRAYYPTCASGYQNEWAFEANTTAGKARLSGLLTAYSTGTNIQITGTGACSYWGDREGVNYFATIE